VGIAKRKWFIYIVRCRDGALYTGIATDVSRRLAEHQGAEGKGAKYLRGRGPLQVVLTKSAPSRGAALRLESRIKRLRRERKEELVARPSLLRSLR
jgi:putative endonuclease